ncbi:hypothetical protein TWF718_007535 [Orbilia javanica]|uniref:F-box domain-containing protein n=1 Tax=Orbilia javanica TaxID=47235 RepID=A0AAN8RII0_9PEZI
MKKFLKQLWPSSAPKAEIEPEGDSWPDPDPDVTQNPTSSNTAYQPKEFIHPPPPNGHPLPTLPAEIHFQILECTDWKEHPTLNQVCKLWRHFLKTSPRILESHYENYSPLYEPSWQSEALKNRPRPYLHRVVEHLEIFVRGRSGKFYPGRIQLVTPWPRHRWDGRWEGTKCKFIEPFNYHSFKDDPLIRYSEGEGEKVNITATELSYSSDGKSHPHSHNWRRIEFDLDVTVGDYIKCLSALIDVEESMAENPTSSMMPANNIVWVTIRPTLMLAVRLRFIIKSAHYELAKDSHLY